MIPITHIIDHQHHLFQTRRDKAIARVAIENPYIKEIIDDAADRPEEVCLTFALNLLVGCLGYRVRKLCAVYFHAK